MEMTRYVPGDKVMCGNRSGVIVRLNCFGLTSTCSYQVKYDDNEQCEHFLGKRCMQLKKI